jgi:hypothetical protein
MRAATMLKCAVFVFVLTSLMSDWLSAQQRGPYSPPPLLDVLPSALTVHAAALGNRVLSAGRERTVLTAQLVNDRGESRNVRVTLQLPNVVRIDGLREDGPLVFDGTSSVATNSRLEEQLLEIFNSDLPETMLASSREGAAVQLLGRRIRSDAGEQKNPSLYDVYEWSGIIASNPRKLERLKRFAFDSETGLLASVQYADETFAPPTTVQIRFSNWRSVDGSAYPGRIERLENGYSSLSLSITAITTSRAQDPKAIGQSEK